jgi:arylsulfatase A-like enzyme
MTPAAKPSVLVLAVEALPYDELACDRPRSNQDSSFEALCQGSVRFTHAFTTSLMSQAAVASLLTGLYPKEHGVWHNGAQTLSGSLETVAEVAVQRRYRTAFFSGGPPLLRKSGLQQGFEIFDDQFSMSLRSIHRPAVETIGEFKRWLTSDVGARPFFSVVYLPDLEFEYAETKTSNDEVREKSYAGQLAEIEETLTDLFQFLKNRGRFDTTHIVLAGVNGYSKRRAQAEYDSLSLLSENSQVALFIKPAQKKRDSAIHWKIDKNVSLADVGATLFELVGGERPPRVGGVLDVVSLRQVLDSPDSHWAADRLILVESAWTQWRGVGPTRVSVRQGHYLLVFDDPPRVYNTLTDRFEMSPLPESDSVRRNLTNEAQRYIEDQGYARWTRPPEIFQMKLAYAMGAWRSALDETTQADLLRRFELERNFDSQVWGWKALNAIGLKDWQRLQQIGSEARRPEWRYVARKNLGQSADPSILSGCHALLAHQRGTFARPGAKQCDDETFLDLVESTRADDEAERLRLRERFWRRYRSLLIERSIHKGSYSHSLVWDTLLYEPRGPSPAELFLALPEQGPVRQFLAKKIREL